MCVFRLRARFLGSLLRVMWLVEGKLRMGWESQRKVVSAVLRKTPIYQVRAAADTQSIMLAVFTTALGCGAAAREFDTKT